MRDRPTTAQASTAPSVPRSAPVHAPSSPSTTATTPPKVDAPAGRPEARATDSGIPHFMGPALEGHEVIAVWRRGPASGYRLLRFFERERGFDHVRIESWRESNPWPHVLDLTPRDLRSLRAAIDALLSIYTERNIDTRPWLPPAERGRR